MKLFWTLFLSLICSINIYSQTIYCSQFPDETIIQKKYLTISYSNQNKIPNYVAYYLTPENLSGNVNRETSFYVEKSLPVKYQSYPSDYTKSGYDKGHMSPAANWKYEKDAMYESFSMANICPQKPLLNRNYWREIEILERKYASECDTLFVITGSIYSRTSKHIKNNITIPDYFYKTCIGVRNGKVVISKAWLYKNTNSKQSATKCQTTIEYIEDKIQKDLYYKFWFNN